MTALATAAITIVILMVATWLVSLAKKNASIVDIVWGFGFVLGPDGQDVFFHASALTEAGIAEARRAGELLKAAGMTFGLAFT